MRQRYLALAATVLIGVTAAVAGVGQASAVEPRVTVRAATWNMCGEFSGCPYTEPSQVDDKGIEVRNLIMGRNLDVVLLQEACEWHANQVLRMLGSSWRMAFAPAKQYDPANGWTGRRVRICDKQRWAVHVQPDATDQALGVAVLIKGEIDQTASYDLTSTTTEYSTTSPLLCVRRKADSVRACSTHFAAPGHDSGENKEQFRRAQAREVAGIVRSFGADRVIVGGDLNSYPVDGVRQRSTILQPIADLMRECEELNTGGLVDAPPTADWGTDRGKLDHLFVKAADGKGTVAGDVIQECHTRDFATMPWSDHTQITGVFTL